MDNQDNQSSWDDLARALGAEAPAESEVPKKTYVKTSVPDEPRKIAEPAPRPKPTPMSWDNLAADLGLEVPPPPPPVEKPKPAERAKIEPAEHDAAPPRPERSSRPERPRRDDRPPRRERSDRSERTERPAQPEQTERPARRDESSEAEGRPRRRSRGGRSQGERSRDDHGRENRQREDRPHPERERRPREESYDEPREELREAPLPPPAPPEPVPQPPAAPGLGVSLWHKIFGTPDQQADRIAESTGASNVERDEEVEIERSDWRRESRRGRDDESFGSTVSEGDAEGSVEVRESWQAESVEFTVDDGGDAERRGDRTAGEEGDDRPRRRRRGRGRGRGRGRRPEGEHTGEERSEDSHGDRSESPRELSDSEAPREPRGRGRGGRSGRPRREDSRRREAPHDNLDDDGLEEIILDDDQDSLELPIDGEEVGGRDVPAGHKSIPSWEEAIGMIVEINLSTRTDRRRSAPSQSRGSGSGSRGGRPRGGRRRKKPS